MRTVCSVEGCIRPAQTRGWCNMHYKRWLRNGHHDQVRQRGICSIADCERPHLARGWCNIHYRRWSRYGDPEQVTQIRGDDETRFWAKVDATGDCWEWVAAGDQSGYGHFWLTAAGRMVMAHRFAYELALGPIPEGLEIDHLCRNRSCVNPGHLEPVTRAENNRRRWAGVSS